MDSGQFRQILATQFGYQSPERRQLLVKYLPRWPSIIYYGRMVIHLRRESALARRGLYDNERWTRASLGVVDIVESAGGRVSISGLKDLFEHRGPLVYIGNHMSLVETFILPAILLTFNDVTFVIKKELLQHPLARDIMQAVDLIAISRQNPRQDLKTVLSDGQQRLAAGCSVVIFPQATRSPVFDPHSFNSLGVKLAQRAGVPVVPIAIKTDFQGNGKLFKDVGPIDPRKKLYFKFGAPITVEGSTRRVHQQIIAFISRNLKQWGGQVRSLEEKASPPAAAAA